MADRIYRFGQEIIDTIDNSEYTNNEPVSASSNLPEIVVINWDDVKTLDKTAIHTVATAKGFVVV